MIKDIIAGMASIDQEIAANFESVLDVSADIWLGIEANDQRNKACSDPFEN